MKKSKFGERESEPCLLSNPTLKSEPVCKSNPRLLSEPFYKSNPKKESEPNKNQQLKTK
jgi:hypothetical protein